MGLFHYAVTQVNANSPAAATGITMVGTSLGVIVGPLTFGLISAHSFSAAWLVEATLSFLGASTLMISQRLSCGARHWTGVSRAAIIARLPADPRRVQTMGDDDARSRREPDAAGH